MWSWRSSARWRFSGELATALLRRKTMLEVLQGDCREVLKTLPSESVHCCVTSPPYWGLRDYGTAQWEGGRPDCDHRDRIGGGTGEASAKQNTSAGSQFFQFKWKCHKCGALSRDSQLGLEPTPDEYVAQMVAVFREVRRVLRHDGTCWLNLGDSYAGSWGAYSYPGDSIAGRRFGADNNGNIARPVNSKQVSGLKPKDLTGIPWSVAFALRADGWYLRSEIIWAKPNPMPESVTDRPTKSHEQIFLLTKASRYFYDAEAIKESVNGNSHGGAAVSSIYAAKNAQTGGKATSGLGKDWPDSTRNKRSVWTVATSPYSDAHFATFPPKLIEPCILAGTSARGCCAECGAPWERITESARTFESGSGRSGNGINGKQPPVQGAGYGDILLGPTISTTTTGWQPACEHEGEPVACTVLDPFAGSGTVGKVALGFGRRAILIELNPKYCEMIQKRSEVTLGLPGLA
jgi:DNA modification methylase